MRKLPLTVGLALTVLLSVAAWGAREWASKATFTPPAETGTIFTVIDYARAGGRAQATYINVEWGSVRRTRIVKPPYRGCSDSTPAGVVLKIRHNRPDSVPLTVSTTGAIVRGPFQGEPPLELVHACYRLVL
ncbi:MAG: hypothetical protein ACJ75H_20905 [Thermoanaerobaculia bacterium]